MHRTIGKFLAFSIGVVVVDFILWLVLSLFLWCSGLGVLHHHFLAVFFCVLILVGLVAFFLLESIRLAVVAMGISALIEIALGISNVVLRLVKWILHEGFSSYVGVAICVVIGVVLYHSFYREPKAALPSQEVA